MVDKLLVERTVREEFANPFETPSTETMRKKADLLWSYLQGPWDQPRVHHYCPPECPCGGTEEKAFSTILELLFWVFCTRMPQAPNPARWATLGPACAWLSLALVIHGIFVRAWLRAFSKEAGAFRPEGEADANGDVGGEGEAFSVAVGRRLARVTQFVGNTTQTAACVTIGLVSQPVDDLTLTMLRLDEQGRALADMLSRRGQAPLRRAQRDLVTLLTDGEVAKAVTSHFDMSGDARETHMGMLRGIIVELGSAIYYRISLYLESYPFKLLDMVRPELSVSQQRAAADHLFQCKKCCLDPFLSGKARAGFTSAQDFWARPAVHSALRAWLNRGRLTVAHIERAHAANKHSFDAVRTSKRHVEAAVYHSFLRQHMVWHVKRGKLNYSLPQTASIFPPRRSVCVWTSTAIDGH